MTPLDSSSEHPQGPDFEGPIEPQAEARTEVAYLKAALELDAVERFDDADFQAGASGSMETLDALAARIEQGDPTAIATHKLNRGFRTMVPSEINDRRAELAGSYFRKAAIAAARQEEPNLEQMRKIAGLAERAATGDMVLQQAAATKEYNRRRAQNR